MYVLNFILHTMVYLPFYAVQKKRYDIALGMLACFGVYFSAFPLLHATVPYFFYTTFGVSFVLGPFALMLGNYSQHIFVDPANPQSNYGLACNHLNAPFNMLTFNDGYHITHHVSSITHWSEMPLHFIRHLDAYEAGGAIIFRELTFDDITFNVFAGEKVPSTATPPDTLASLCSPAYAAHTLACYLTHPRRSSLPHLLRASLTHPRAALCSVCSGPLPPCKEGGADHARAPERKRACRTLPEAPPANRLRGDQA